MLKFVSLITLFGVALDFAVGAPYDGPQERVQPRNPLSQIKPVLGLNNPPSRIDFMIQNNCGEDNICAPNLHVNVTSPNVNKYLLGSNTTLDFDVVVSNFGEDSFETTFEMAYPTDAIFYKKSVTKTPAGLSCTVSKNETVLCDIGNPLPSGKIASFKLVFLPNYQGGFSNRTYVFDVLVNSSNHEPLSSLAIGI